MSNTVLDALTLLVLAAHLAAPVAAVIRRNATPMLGLNLAVGAVILLVFAAHPRWLLGSFDWQLTALAGFEAVAVGLAIAGLRHIRFARPLSWAVFAVHLLASGAAALFALTFKMTRLF